VALPAKKISVEQIVSDLCTFIQSNIVDKKNDVTPETSFSSLGIDSLSVVEMVLFMERKYNLALPEEELIPENFKTVNTLAACAHRCLSNG